MQMIFNRLLEIQIQISFD